MKPYFYKIKEKQTGKIYVGCQYGVKSDPANFWVTYFTSNKYVKSQPKNAFNVVLVKERHDAREYEKRYLQKCYRLLGRERFIELLINRNIAPGILNTPESILKANIKRKISNSIAAKKRVANGTHNFILNPHIPTKEERDRSSKRMKGNQFAKLMVRDEEYRKKQATNSKGNKNVRGKKWWNNGSQRKRSKECPGEEWKEGFLFNRG
jgi:hypothetical protein